MAYEKMHNIFDLAIRMQSSAEGISITDVMQQFDVSRRTAERMRNFIRERFPQLTETIGEHGVKRWHLPYGALKNYISFSAEEISTLQNALRLLKHVQLCEQSRTLAGLLTKLKAMMRPEVCCRIETDTEIMQASEGYLFRPVQKSRSIRAIWRCSDMPLPPAAKSVCAGQKRTLSENGRRYVRTPSFTAPNITLSLIRKKNGSFSTSV